MDFEFNSDSESGEFLPDDLPQEESRDCRLFQECSRRTQSLSKATISSKLAKLELVFCPTPKYQDYFVQNTDSGFVYEIDATWSEEQPEGEEPKRQVINFTILEMRSNPYLLTPSNFLP